MRIEKKTTEHQSYEHGITRGSHWKLRIRANGDEQRTKRNGTPRKKKKGNFERELCFRAKEARNKSRHPAPETPEKKLENDSKRGERSSEIRVGKYYNCYWSSFVFINNVWKMPNAYLKDIGSIFIKFTFQYLFIFRLADSF